MLWFNVAVTPIPVLTLQDYVIESNLNFTIKTEQVTITGYSSRKCETDNTPFETASLDSVQIGCITLSPDLIRKYGFYQLVTIEGFSSPFIVLDVMNKRYTNRADIWFPGTNLAYAFGQKHNLRLTIFIPNHPNIDELYLCNKRFPVGSFKI